MLKASNRALVLLYPNCITFEVMLLLELLRQNGYNIDSAYPNTRVHEDSSGLVMKPHLVYDEIQSDLYACVIVPGGDPGSIMDDKRVDGVLRAADERRLPIAGISAGVLVLAKTGILKGRRITHTYRAPFAPRHVEDFVAAYWSGARVVAELDKHTVRDSNIVTSHANGFIDFALEVTQLLGIHDRNRASLLRNYYRGMLEADSFG